MQSREWYLIIRDLKDPICVYTTDNSHANYHSYGSIQYNINTVEHDISRQNYSKLGAKFNTINKFIAEHERQEVAIHLVKGPYISSDELLANNEEYLI